MLSIAAGDGNEQTARRTEPALLEHGGVTEARRYAATRPGTVAFALMTEAGRIHGRNVDTPFRSASMTKAMLLVAVLRRAAARSLTGKERKQVAPMITASDNDAADEVYASVGDLGLQAVAQAAHMLHLQPVGALFETRITAADQARLFLRIDRYVPRRHRAYAMGLLRNVIPAQRWGIAAAVPHGWRIAFKGGWGKGETREVDHQVALLTRGRERVSVAVLTADNPSDGYGFATIQGVAARLLRGLGGTIVGRARPGRERLGPRSAIARGVAHRPRPLKPADRR